MRTPWDAINGEYLNTPTPDPKADLKVVIGVLVSTISLILLNYFAMNPHFQHRWAVKLIGLLESRGIKPGGAAPWVYGNFVEHLIWVVGCLFVYVLLPAATIKLVFRERLRDYGLSTRGFWRHLPWYLLLFLPVGIAIIVASNFKGFQTQYPFYKPPVGWTDLLLWEFGYLCQFFMLEFFFRGFMLNTLKHRFGAYAVLVMVIPYTMIHFQKPIVETFGAILAGTILGVIALRTRSIWGGVVIHCLAAASMDVAAITHHIGGGKFWFWEHFR